MYDPLGYASAILNESTLICAVLIVGACYLVHVLMGERGARK